MPSTTTGYIIFAHGSSVESANDAVRRLSADFAARRGDVCVATAFLELGKPDLNGAVDELVAQGARQIRVLPYFLTLGIHLQRDLPKLVAQAQVRHPSITITVAPPLDGHAGLVGILMERAAEVAD